MYGVVSELRVFFFFKQKTSYVMRISDWSSDVCSSDLSVRAATLSLHGTGRTARRRPRLYPRSRPCQPRDGLAAAPARGAARQAFLSLLCDRHRPLAVPGAARMGRTLPRSLRPRLGRTEWGRVGKEGVRRW